MKSRRTRRFHECFAQLPSDIQSQARQAYQPVVKAPLHSIGAASRLAALLLGHKCPNLLPRRALPAGRRATAPRWRAGRRQTPMRRRWTVAGTSGSGARAGNHFDLHRVWHARHLSNHSRPYTKLNREVVSQIIGTGGGPPPVTRFTASSSRVGQRRPAACRRPRPSGESAPR